MEEKSSLFSMSVDPVAKIHLAETVKWARFLAHAGFVFLLILIGIGVYSSIAISRFEEDYRNMGIGGAGGMMNSAGFSVALIYIGLAVVTFFPLLFLLRYANNMAQALQSNNQALLNASFQNLKICFRYLGILTFISLVIVALTLVFGIAGLALS